MKILPIREAWFAGVCCAAACSPSATPAGPGSGGMMSAGGDGALAGAPSAMGGQAATGGGAGPATAGASAAGRGAAAGMEAGAAGGLAAGGSGTGGSGGTGAAAGSNGGGSASPGTCPVGGWAPGKQTIKTQWDGVARQYVVYIPKSYTGTSPVPLMLVIHGAHNTPALAENWSQMDPVSDQNGFIIAYPAGLDCWNAGGILGGCTAADDDLGFLKNVVTEVESHACIDPKRVYATGISNGSIMAQYLGCQAADIFASVGGVAGPTPQPCTPSRSLSVFYVHGTADQTVAFSSAQPNVTGWVTREHCDSTAVQVYSQGSTTCTVNKGCTDGAEVEFCAVTGMGHCWPEDTKCGPQSGAGVTDFKASPPMWEFFSKHPMP
jgi:polyhydroxybutyrate depolymerase